MNINQLKEVVDKDYWKLFEVIYKDYNWYKQTADMNYILRFILRVGFFLENTFYGVIFISYVLMITFIIYSIGTASFNGILFRILLAIFLGSTFLYLFLSVYTTAAEDTKQKKTTGDIIRENYFSFQSKIIRTSCFPVVLIWKVLKYIFKLLKKFIVYIIPFFKNDQRYS